MQTSKKLILGIGSNMGDRVKNLYDACHILKESGLMGNLKYSSIYLTKALLPENAPQDWDMDFCNMAISGDSTNNHFDILDFIKYVETKMGRIDRGKWSPREIDIDILAYGDVIADDSRVSIPHPQLLNRDFAIAPLAEIEPDWRYPAIGEYFGKSAKEILELTHKESELCKQELNLLELSI